MLCSSFSCGSHRRIYSGDLPINSLHWNSLSAQVCILQNLHKIVFRIVYLF